MTAVVVSCLKATALHMQEAWRVTHYDTDSQSHITNIATTGVNPGTAGAVTFVTKVFKCNRCQLQGQGVDMHMWSYL